MSVAFWVVALLGIAFCLRLLFFVLAVTISVHRVQYYSRMGVPIEIPTRVGGVEYVHRSR